MDATLYRSVIFTLALSLATGGCKQAPKAGPNAAGVQNSDGSITNPDGSVTYPARTAPVTAAVRNADGSITNPDGSVTYPKGSPQAQRETSPQSVGAPAAPAPAPPAPTAANAPAPPPAPPALTVPIGTPLSVRITETLSASRNDVGDHFTGVLNSPILDHGNVVFPRGTPISGEVVASKQKGRFKGAGDLGIELTYIGKERIHTTEYEDVAKGRGKRSFGFIGGGAGIGGLIGGLAGGGKGALIGSLAGAGGGTAADAYTGNRDVVLPSESVVRFRLTQPLTR